MYLAARSPRSRQSLSLQEHNMNINQLDNVTLPVTNKELHKGKHRAVMSMSGEELAFAGFQIPRGNTNQEMSPRRKARRSMVSRLDIQVVVQISKWLTLLRSNHGNPSLNPYRLPLSEAMTKPWMQHYCLLKTTRTRLRLQLHLTRI